MKYYFVNDSFIQNIEEKVFNTTFPSLNITEKKILLEYTVKIIDLIAVKFNFNKDKFDSYEKQFYQNDYRDVLAIINMLLPFIDDDTGEKKKRLQSFNQLVIEKKENCIKNINNGTPKYVYTNFQYSRCQRTNILEETSFDLDFLRQNFVLLKYTIYKIANKLFVNWIDILPFYQITNYTSYILFQNLFYLFVNRKLHDWDFTDENDEQGYFYQGITVDDIYDVIANDFFNSIKNIKFLIYDLPTENNTLIPFVSLLNKILPLDKAINNVSFNMLSELEKRKFENQWSTLVSASLSDSQIDNISADTIKRIAMTIVIFFDKYSKYVNEAEKEDDYQRLTVTYDLEEDDEDNDLRTNNVSIKFDDIKKSIRTLKAKYVYEYLRDCLTLLTQTFYGKELVKYDNGFYTILFEPVNLQDRITLKNLYNYSKSLTHYKGKKTVNGVEKDSYLEYPRYWRMLSKDDKKIILDRLNFNEEQNDVTEWFNISRYIKKLNISWSIKEAHNYIFNKLRQNVPHFIFISLLTKGILSNFEPVSALTDTSLLPTNPIEKENTIKRLIKDPVKNYEDSYNFLTGLQYKDMYFNYYENDEPKKKLYIDYIIDNAPSNWFYIYALDWMSQIAFFHHYLNNRVIYVTGATGVGKSTQTPKLLLYALKMIDYKDRGKICCTQPRIPPTKGNARTVSAQLGVPIFESDKIKSNNYYLQYKTKEDSHTGFSSGLLLKIVTDRLLLKEMLNYPVLKRRVNNNNNYTYYSSNVYDIIMVDEAHEHNANMDMILSIMKPYLYYNNDLKLVIVSATMDDDEPVYRRFYRDINDNRMFPLNSYLVQYQLDRINVDRRFHISPPGQTTRYKITDIAVPDTDGILKVVEIDQTTSSGDILFFQPGSGEISKAVAELNERLKPGTIAVPYYSDMPESKKSLIEGLNDQVKRKFRIPKDVMFNQDYDESQIKLVPEGTYNRFVIVATNIAEASITLSSLRYVVDTGTQKSGEYYYYTRSPELKLGPISESSRLQRRGRVGRVAEGTVYYLYKIDAMINNRIRFGISTGNIYEDLYEMMRNNPNEKPLFEFDPHKLTSSDFNSLNEKFKNGLSTFISNQYFIKNIFFDYVGHNSDNLQIIAPYYQTGFSRKTLYDQDGTFWIVHPEELCFDRRIDGKIINILNKQECSVTFKENGIIKSKKMDSFFMIMIERLLAFIINKDLQKTTYGINLMSSKQLLEMYDTDEINNLISLLYGYRYNINEDMIKLIAMFRTINGSVKSLAIGNYKDGKYVVEIESLKQRYGSKYSDAVALIKIADDIINFTNRYINLIDFEQTVINYNRSFILSEKQKFINKRYKEMNQNILQSLKKMESKNELFNTDSISEKEIFNLVKTNVMISAIYTIFEKNENNIKEWCKLNRLNYKTVLKFIDQYIRFKNNILKYEKRLNDEEYELISNYVPLSYYDVLPKTFDPQKELIPTVCLLHGYGYQIGKRIGGTDFYIQTTAPDAEFVLPLKKIVPTVNIKDCLIDTSLLDYVLFIAKSSEGISLLHNVLPEYIQKCVPFVFNPSNLNETSYPIDKYVNNLTDQVSKIGYKEVTDYSNALQKIRYDMINWFQPSILYQYDRLDSSSEYKRFINIVQNENLSTTVATSMQSGGFKNNRYIFNDFIQQIIRKN